MHFFILILLLCFFIFLFSLYFLSHDDFVLLRRDISPDLIFNTAFLMVPVSLIFSRLFYVISNPSGNFLNPLYFLLFPYFPGLSLVGGVLGTGIFLFLFFRFKKMPVGRLLDLFALSFIACMPAGAAGYFLLSGANFMSFTVLFTIISYIVLFLFFSFFLFPRFLKGRVGEGIISTLFLMAFSFIFLVGKISAKSYFDIENVLVVLILISSTSFYFMKEKLLSKFKI